MTQKELIQLLKQLLANYPNAINKIDSKDLLKNWEMAFGNEDAQTIYMAARYHMSKSPFFPTIADIKKSINKGQMMYGGQPQPSSPAIEAPKAPHKLIKAEEEKCKYERCVLYHDLCNGLENGKCPFEGL